MALIKAEFSEEFYKSLTDDNRGNMTVIESREGTHDYSHDDLWIDLKYKATRAYKKLKERESKLRQ